MARLVNAASIHPKVLQVITPGMLRAESKLIVATLALAGAIREVLEGHFLALDPSVREYCVRRNRVISDKVLGEAEGACVASLQQTHSVLWEGPAPAA
jgi:hypothetical protein